TAFSFTSSVSGVKGDEYVSDNGDNWDASWDPIWYMKTSIDSEGWIARSEEHTSELQSRENLVCRLLLEKKKLPGRAGRRRAGGRRAGDARAGGRGAFGGRGRVWRGAGQGGGGVGSGGRVRGGVRLAMACRVASDAGSRLPPRTLPSSSSSPRCYAPGRIV